MGYSFNLAEKIFRCLKESPGTRFTAGEVANWIYENYREDCEEKRARSTATVEPLYGDAIMIKQITKEVGSIRPALQRKYPNIRVTERPRKYYYSEENDDSELFTQSDEIETEPVSNRSFTAPPTIKEHELYPVLAEFLQSELGIYSKRIDEKRSSNTRGAGGNKWLHPDIVGMEDLSQSWHPKIKDCVNLYDTNKKAKLWSFEVKVRIDVSNLQEAFFQAVSNSSWANFGYLVANEIEGAEKKLRMLNSLHGIGFIKLDAENPSENQIMIPARERDNIDWNMANQIAQENTDFQKYLEAILDFCNTGKVHKENWDKVQKPKD